MREVEVNWVTGLPEIPFNGGSPTAVVMHFTDNFNSTPDSERAWMAKNYENAFVHEFIGPYKSLQTANPKFKSYGAGPKMNPYAIHLELCVAKSQAEFDASFYEWCSRAAYHLSQNNLSVRTPQYKGDTGTLWSHLQVTQYLGGTTHEDPIQYLKGWSKTWQDVVSMVTKIHKEMNNVAKQTNFSDVPEGHWAEGSIAAMGFYHFMEGYGDGTFKPDQPITRAEVAKIMSSAMWYLEQKLKGGV